MCFHFLVLSLMPPLYRLVPLFVSSFFSILSRGKNSCDWTFVHRESTQNKTTNPLLPGYNSFVHKWSCWQIFAMSVRDDPRDKRRKFCWRQNNSTETLAFHVQPNPAPWWPGTCLTTLLLKWFYYSANKYCEFRVHFVLFRLQQNLTAINETFHSPN